MLRETLSDKQTKRENCEIDENLVSNVAASLPPFGMASAFGGVPNLNLTLFEYKTGIWFGTKFGTKLKFGIPRKSETKREERLMTEVQIQLPEDEALHARLATQIVKSIQGLQAEVMLTDGQAAATAESVLVLLTLGAGPGTVLTVRADGPDAEKAVSILRETVEEHGSSDRSERVDADAPFLRQQHPEPRLS